VRHLLLVCLLLLVPARASALTWWVVDEPAAETLRGELDRLWPTHTLDVAVGDPSARRQGVWYADGELVLVAAGRVRWQRAGAEAATQIALVRSWLRTMRSSGVEAPPKLGPGPWVGASVGGGLRLPTVEPGLDLGPAWPAAWVGASGGVAWRSVQLGGQLALTLGEQAGSGRPVRVTRIFGGARIGLLASLGRLTLENHVGFGARIAVLEADQRAVVPLPSFDVGVHLLGPAAPDLLVGGGLRIGIDTAPLRVVGGDGDLLLSPVTLHAELAIRFGGARAKKP